MAQDSIADFRSAYRLNNGFIHMNNSGVAPISLPALRSLQAWSERLANEGAFCIEDLLNAVEITRTRLAGFLGASTQGTAFFPNTASALSQIAFGLSLQKDDDIIVWDQEYPSNLYPWKVAAERTGARLILAPSGTHLSTPVENILACLTPKTKIIAFSWVQFQTGAITDLQALTHEARARGIFTVADIIQGAGLLPFNFAESGLDAACGGSHKWLTSPLSTGYLCLREEHVTRLEPLSVGAITYGTPDTPIDLNAKPKANIHRFEPGSKNMADIAALGASLELIEKTGIARIAQEAEWLAKRLMHGLRERGYAINSPHGSHHRGAIVNFQPSAQSRTKTLGEIEAKLHKNKISFALRAGGVRLAPHAFNTADEIDQIMSLL